MKKIFLALSIFVTFFSSIILSTTASAGPVPPWDRSISCQLVQQGPQTLVRVTWRQNSTGQIISTGVYSLDDEPPRACPQYGSWVSGNGGA